jgi:hypothetical protein
VLSGRKIEKDCSLELKLRCETGSLKKQPTEIKFIGFDADFTAGNLSSISISLSSSA